MSEPMQNFEDPRWKKLIQSFRQRVDDDKKHFNFSNSWYVKLPEICPKPMFCLIGMEPGPGKNEYKEPEYRNFTASKSDFIIHYCAYHYLGGEGFNYHMTDMAKGAIKINDAGNTREERYKIWLPFLEKELALLGNPKIIFIGKGTYNENINWELNLPVVKDHFILQHGGAARGWVKRYYDSIPNISNYNPPVDVKVTVKEMAIDLMEKHGYPQKLKDELLKDAFNRDFTDADKRLLAVYRYDFERFSKIK